MTSRERILEAFRGGTPDHVPVWVWGKHDIESMPTPRFRELVENTVAQGMPGGGFILSPTATPFGWPVMSALARENWLAMLDVGLRKGMY